MSIYKSASIVPYYKKDGQYLYLLAHEKGNNYCGSFGGRMDPSDKNNTWTNACREMGEELWGLDLHSDPKVLNNYVYQVKKKAQARKVGIPNRKKKHYLYYCPVEDIILKPGVFPDNIRQKFKSNKEIKKIHWVRGEDLWKAVSKADGKKLYGKYRHRAWVPVYNEDRKTKVELRPCFLDSCLYVYRRGMIKRWEK